MFPSIIQIEIILTKTNIKIIKNSVLGIKGETGSGKSTFIKLLMSLIEPNSGTIKVDNLPLKNIQNSWQEKISYVPQNFYIFDDTILENIVFSEEKTKVNLDKINKILNFVN